MAKHTFTVVYELDGEQHDIDFSIDIGEWVEEDFLGGEGQEHLEDLLTALHPKSEMCWVECPEDLPE